MSRMPRQSPQPHPGPAARALGTAVHVFSRSAGAWVHGEVTELFEQDFVRVEFVLESFLCRKTLHVESRHLALAALSDDSAEEENDPDVALKWKAEEENDLDVAPKSKATCCPMGDLRLYQAARELYEAARLRDDVSLVEGLVGCCDPAMLLPDVPLTSSALHVAAHRGHIKVLVFLLETVDARCRGRFSLDEHKNGMGESLRDIIRRRCHERPGEAPGLKEVLKRFSAPVDANSANGLPGHWAELPGPVCARDAKNSHNKRTFNASFVEAVSKSPLVGDRLKPFDFEEFVRTRGVQQVICGLQQEWRRFMEDSPTECAYEAWSSMRKDMLQDYATEVQKDGVAAYWMRRAGVDEMARRLRESADEGCEALFRCAIWIYTLHSFVYLAVNTAMRTRDEARFGHLSGFVVVLHHAVKAHKQKAPFKERVYRVMPLDESMLERYTPHPSGDTNLDLISWDGFTSACKSADKALQNLEIYGSPSQGKATVLFVISAADDANEGNHVFPADISSGQDCAAAFGPVEKEVLYALGQQFQIMGRQAVARADLPAHLGIGGDQTAAGANTGYVEVVQLEAVDRFYEFANDLFRDGGDPQAALQLLQSKLKEEEASGSKAAVGGCLSCIGKAHHCAGNMQLALAAHQKALNIAEMTLGPEHPDTASRHGNLGLVLRKMGDLQGALAAHQKALNIREKVLGPEHPGTACSHNDLGLVLDEMGNLQGALAAHQKALNIFETALGPEHPKTATSHGNLGVVLRKMGDLQGALAAHQKALNIAEKALGPEHPNTATGHGNLGLVLRKMGDLQGALAAHQKALGIREKALGPEHPNTAHSHNSLGAVLHDMGNLQEALAAHQKALNIREKVLGPEHPDTACSRNHLGVVLDEMGNLQGALAAHQKALNIREKALGPEHPGTAISHNNLGLVLDDMGNLQEALAALGPEHPDTARSHRNLRAVLQAVQSPFVTSFQVGASF